MLQLAHTQLLLVLGLTEALYFAEHKIEQNLALPRFKSRIGAKNSALQNKHSRFSDGFINLSRGMGLQGVAVCFASRNSAGIIPQMLHSSTVVDCTSFA